MNMLLFISGPEIVVILLVVLVLFGSSKIPEMAKGLGKGLSEFKKASDDIKNEINRSTSDIKEDIDDFKNDIEDDSYLILLSNEDQSTGEGYALKLTKDEEENKVYQPVIDEDELVQIQKELAKSYQ